MKIREQQKKETRKKILNIAKLQIEERGYAATTIKSISKEAGVAAGTVFVHFENKEDLLYSAFYEDLQNIVDAAMSNVNETSTLHENLYGVVSHFFLTFASRAKLYTVFMDHSLLSKGAWGEKFREQVSVMGMQIGAMYEKAKKKNEISPETNTRTAVTAFFSFYYFALINAIKSDFKNIEEHLKMFSSLMEQHLNGLKPRR